MALMQVRLLGTFHNQATVNVFNYHTVSTPAVVSHSFALAAAMGFVDAALVETGNIKAAWRAVSSSGFSVTEIEVKDVFSLTDFYVQPIILTPEGSVAGDSMPPSTAYALQTSRVRADVRRGSKRLPGVPRSLVGDGGLITALGLIDLTILTDQLSASIVYTDEGSPLTYVPVVVSKEPYVTPQGNPGYKYWETEALQVQHMATGILWAPKQYVSTQVSRKRGRGV